MSARRALTGLVRVAVGAGLLWFVVLREPGVIEEVGRARPGGVALALGLEAAVLAAGLARWRAYLKALEISPGFGSLVRLHSAGAFLNAFLPTGVGGDAYKAYRLGRAGYSRHGAAASVFLDRLAGMVGLAVVGLAAASGAAAAGVAPARVVLPVLGVCVAIFAGEIFLAFLGGHLGRRWTGQGWRGSLGRAAADVRAAGRHPVAMFRGYAIGVLTQAGIALVHVVVARALGLDIPAAVIVCAATLAQVAALVPVTINGLGLREATYVLVLGTIAVDSAAARAFAVLNLAVLLGGSLLSGAVALATGARISSAPGSPSAPG